MWVQGHRADCVKRAAADSEWGFGITVDSDCVSRVAADCDYVLRSWCCLDLDLTEAAQPDPVDFQGRGVISIWTRRQ